MTGQTVKPLQAKKRRPKKTAAASISSPFTPEILAEIFKTSLETPDRLLSRESGWLEFKESYNWNSWPEYARTLAGFANAEGASSSSVLGTDRDASRG
jgi:hypothetical protein